jgi:cytochrome b561
MPLKNTAAGYGLVSRLIHWIMALAIFVVFGIGIWMIGLDYQNPYYRLGPDIHRSVGILLLIALVFRYLWRLVNVLPNDSELTPFERKASHIVHLVFYPLLAAVMISGYFISSAGGQAVDVFDWFSIPAVTKQPGLESQAGFVHRWLAYGTVALAAVHTIAALKHHFVEKSRVLTRMWSGS